MGKKNYFYDEEELTKSDKKWLCFMVYAAVLVISGFMYHKVEILLTSFVFITFSWIMLIFGFSMFFLKGRVREFFHKNMYSVREYSVIYNTYFASLTDKEKTKDKGIEKPLRDLLFSLKLYPVLIAITFLLELCMNRLGYNWLVAPGAVLFYTLQVYFTYQIIKDLFVHWNAYRVFKNGELEL